MHPGCFVWKLVWLVAVACATRDMASIPDPSALTGFRAPSLSKITPGFKNMLANSDDEDKIDSDEFDLAAPAETVDRDTTKLPPDQNAPQLHMVPQQSESDAMRPSTSPPQQPTTQPTPKPATSSIRPGPIQSLQFAAETSTASGGELDYAASAQVALRKAAAMDGYQDLCASGACFCEKQGSVASYVKSDELAWLTGRYTGTDDIHMCTHGEGEMISDYIMRDGGWEVQLMSMIGHLSEHFATQRENLTFLDVGSNMGTMGLIPAAYGHKSYMFEPVESNAEKICRSLAISGNSSAGSVCLIQAAIGDHAGSLYMSPLVKNGPGRNSGTAKVLTEGEDSDRVVILTLDAVAAALNLPSPGINIVVKVDVEGYEKHVWDGGRTIFENRNTQVVFIEVTWKGHDVDTYCAWLQGIVELGYELLACVSRYHRDDGSCTRIEIFDSCHNMTQWSEYVLARPAFASILSTTPFWERPNEPLWSAQGRQGHGSKPIVSPTPSAASRYDDAVYVPPPPPLPGEHHPEPEVFTPDKMGDDGHLTGDKPPSEMELDEGGIPLANSDHITEETEGDGELEGERTDDTGDDYDASVPATVQENGDDDEVIAITSDLPLLSEPPTRFQVTHSTPIELRPRPKAVKNRSPLAEMMKEIWELKSVSEQKKRLTELFEAKQITQGTYTQLSRRLLSHPGLLHAVHRSGRGRSLMVMEQ